MVKYEKYAGLNRSVEEVTLRRKGEGKRDKNDSEMEDEVTKKGGRK